MRGSNGNNRDVNRTVFYRQASAKSAVLKSDLSLKSVTRTSAQAFYDQLKQWKPTWTLTELRKWAREQDNDRWIKDALAARSLKRARRLTITFKREIDERTAKGILTRWLCYAKRRMAIIAYVSLMARGDRGKRVHAHMLVWTPGWVLWVERYILRQAIAHGKAKIGLGHCRVQPVNDAGQARWYLMRDYKRHSVKGRSITYSQNIRRRKYWQLTDEEKAALRTKK
jgi:hypothetical protein